MSPDLIAQAALWLLIGAPSAVLCGLGLPILCGWKPSERLVSAVTQAGAAAALLASCVMALVSSSHTESFSLLDLPGHSIVLCLQLDANARLWSFTVALLCLLGIRFAETYLHREKRFASFHLLFAVLQLGMFLATVGGNLNTVFAGWELAGISSALLIAFFSERRSPVQASLRAFAIYRICDVGFIAGAALLHHQIGDVDFAELAALPLGSTTVACTAISLLLLFAAAGKSAQLPMSGWLARAMEGPTPSSALFYGGLSVHLGVLLLIRAQPLFAQSPVALWAVGILGGLTALHATAVARVQADVKSALAYATLTQVGLMFVECALGWTQLASIHFCLHAFLRTFQLLRAPSALAEANAIRAAHGGRLPLLPRSWGRWVPQRFRVTFYAWALERFGTDLLLERIVSPWVSLSVSAQRGLKWLRLRVGGKTDKPAAAVSGPAPQYMLAAFPLAAFAGFGASTLATVALTLLGALLAFGERSPYRVLGGLAVSSAGVLLFGFCSGGELVSQASWLAAISYSASLGGLFLLLRVLEKRIGRERLDAANFLGLVGQTPVLAGAFACFALAMIGFPGTLGFVAEELLLGGAFGEHPWAMTALLLAAAVNGFTVFRLFARLFFGASHFEVEDLAPKDRIIAVVVLAALVGAGLFPSFMMPSSNAQVSSAQTLSRR